MNKIFLIGAASLNKINFYLYVHKHAYRKVSKANKNKILAHQLDKSIQCRIHFRQSIIH